MIDLISPDPDAWQVVADWCREDLSRVAEVAAVVREAHWAEPGVLADPATRAIVYSTDGASTLVEGRTCALAYLSLVASGDLDHARVAYTMLRTLGYPWGSVPSVPQSATMAADRAAHVRCFDRALVWWASYGRTLDPRHEDEGLRDMTCGGWGDYRALTREQWDVPCATVKRDTRALPWEHRAGHRIEVLTERRQHQPWRRAVRLDGRAPQLMWLDEAGVGRARR